MSTTVYKGIRIDPQPRELADGGWTANFTLSEERGSETIDTPYYGKSAYATLELAEQAAIQMAYRQIDGR